MRDFNTSCVSYITVELSVSKSSISYQNISTESKRVNDLYMEGIKPDPKKLNTIKQMRPSINKRWLSSFLDMVTYLSSSMQDISDVAADLKGFIKKDSILQWTIL